MSTHMKKSIDYCMFVYLSYKINKQCLNISINHYIYEFSAVLIYTSAISDLFLFHMKCNFTFLTMFLLFSCEFFLDKDFRITLVKTYLIYTQLIFSIEGYNEVQYFWMFFCIILSNKQQGLESNRTNTTSSLLRYKLSTLVLTFFNISFMGWQKHESW